MEFGLHSHQFTEDNVKKTYISPMTSLLMSLSLVAGIFVAGLTNSRVLPAAKAQNVQQVTFGAPYATVAGTVMVARGVVVNGVASDALIPGTVRISDTVVDSGCGLTALGFSMTGDMVYALGVFTSGNIAGGDDPTGPNGVFTSGNLAGGDLPTGPNGVFTSGNLTGGDQPIGPSGVFTSGNVADEDSPAGPSGVFTSGNVYVGDNLQIVGGVLTGSNIQITNGVISGSDLQVTGAYVTSACGH
jgi:hypothetical protein